MGTPVDRPARKAVSLLVKLQSRDVGAFAEQYATNISLGGMFIRTREPRPVGTFLSFKIEIAGGQRVLQGTASVQWVRAPGDPAGPPGMGLKFHKLDPASEALVRKMVEDAPLRKAATPAHGTPLPVTPAHGVARPVTPARGTPLPSVAPSIAPVTLPAAAAAPVEPLPNASAAAPPSVPPLAAVAEAPLSAAAPAGKAGGQKAGGASAAIVPPVPEPSAAPPSATASSAAPPSEGEVELDFDTLLTGTPPPPPTVPPPPDEQLFAARVDLEVKADEGLLLSELLGDPGEQGEPAPAAPPPRVAPVTQARARPPEPAAAPEPPPTVAPVTVSEPEMVALTDRPVFLRSEGTPSSEGPVIGIDLGTTNSCVAIASNGRPQILSSKDGYNTIPSVIALSPQDKVMVGRRAQQQMILQPHRTVYGAKRLVGREYLSATVQQVKERSHFEIIADSERRAAVRLGPHALTLDEVQGLVLRECREIAEQHLGTSVRRAVITCPAYYSEQQREAVRRAGALAGLKVERILNEPTAAALAYGANKSLNKTVLVYDLGGGTFDATLLRIDKNVFEVLATGGDVFLGGVDFDNQLVDYLLEGLATQTGKPVKPDPVVLSRIRDAAERAKVQLSERTSVDLHLPMLMMDEQGTPVDLKRALTRAEVDRVCADLVARTMEVVSDVLLDAKLKPSQVDDVILVGGQSRMPLVREKLQALFKKPPQASVNADEAVAAGAALFTNTLDKVSSVVLIDVVPMTIGIAQSQGAFKRIIERNTALPAQRSFSVPTVMDKQEAIEFSLFQGEDSSVAGNEYLGTVRVEGLPRAPKGSVQLAVTLKLDAECVLHVEAVELKTRRSYDAKLSTRYTPEQIQKKLGISQERVAASQQKRADELSQRSGRFWGALKKMVRRS